MTFSNKALLALALVAAFTSCKKDDEGDPAPAIPPVQNAALAVEDFSNLVVGNYWVYERRQVDSLDVDQGSPIRLDSLYVIGDTLLDGETFAMIRLGINGQPGNGVRYYWRDSADRIVDRNGSTLFSATTFDQVLYTESTGGPSGVNIDYVIPSGTVPIAVPAGSYDAYLVLGQCTSFGTFPVIPEWKFPRDYWAEGVGRVKWYDYYAAGSLGERFELMRYYVQ
jgi:hypothetical protein